MRLVERFLAALTYLLNVLTFSELQAEADYETQQHPLVLPESRPDPSSLAGPIFKPPGGAFEGDGSEFVCDYSNMVGWRPCSTPTNRGCWLKHDLFGEFNIDIDYEKYAPVGIVRKYSLTVGAGEWNADGQMFKDAKLFNKKYPGPWVQACWGDVVEVTVTVDKGFPNGTAVHWHGIRQNQTMHMDGVPGITQCPIAPQSKFVYRWNATQYGSSWYHSHYSLQYADGLLGPLTIHGPSTGQYDEAGTLPLLITDWGHVSAFKIIYGQKDKNNPGILLNGKGDVTKCNPGVVPDQTIPNATTISFQPGKKYLLRVINTAYDTTFLFTIDNHEFTVVSVDFVPISPYETKSLVVGIGQRYNIIVKAKPLTDNTNKIPTDLNFWIRTYVLDDCFGSAPPGPNYMEIGILRYNPKSETKPTSLPWSDLDTKTCKGENGWKPYFPWIVGAQTNPVEQHDVFFKKNPSAYPLARFGMAPPVPTPVKLTALRVDYQNVTFRNLDNAGGWPDPWVMVTEDGTYRSWVYLVITGGGTGSSAHPIHLHGHDFAILAQKRKEVYNASTVVLNLNNPPRRDVVLLPQGGYVVIAFKTDNPGAWLMHCHIANHASEGLALQIMEDREKARQIWPTNNSTALNEAAKLCKEWDNWMENCANRWNKKCDQWFQDDSGI